MNKFYSIIFCCFFMSFYTYSDRATINISGKLLDKTCTISPKTGDELLVDMGLIDYRVNNQGSLLSGTQFSIELEDCSSNISTIYISFKGNSDNLYPDKLKIRDNEGDAKGIAIALFDNYGKSIDIRDNKIAFTLKNNFENQKLNFIASLFSTTKNNLTAGKINSTTYFEISYE